MVKPDLGDFQSSHGVNAASDEGLAAITEQMMTIDGFVVAQAVERLDFIKMNVEGEDVEFLRGRETA